MLGTLQSMLGTGQIMLGTLQIVLGTIQIMLSLVLLHRITVNSEIFARVLFSWNFADTKIKPLITPSFTDVGSPKLFNVAKCLLVKISEFTVASTLMALSRPQG